MKAFSVFLRNREDGATSVEYALMAVLIAVAIVVTVTTFGGNVEGLFQRVASIWPG